MNEHSWSRGSSRDSRQLALVEGEGRHPHVVIHFYNSHWFVTLKHDSWPFIRCNIYVTHFQSFNCTLMNQTCKERKQESFLLRECSICIKKKIMGRWIIKSFKLFYKENIWVINLKFILFNFYSHWFSPAAFLSQWLSNNNNCRMSVNKLFQISALIGLFTCIFMLFWFDHWNSSWCR